MTAPIVIVLTNAGLDALVNAQQGSTAPIQISQLGLTEQAFFPAPTLTALPGEFKRIATFAGQSVSETVIHMTAQDSEPDTYDLRGFGLFLSDGTLFATFGQPEPITSKTSFAAFLFSINVAFADTGVDAITFGDASFLYPPATETVEGVARIATNAEVQAGTDDETIVTPLKLAAIVGQILGGFVSASETVQGVIELATQAEVTAGTDNTRAVTPLKLATALNAAINAVNTSIAAETAARQSGDASAISQINTETATRAAADSGLQSLVDALRAISITGTGLVTGGGTLTQSRQLQVLAASGAEALAEALTSKALTPASLAGFARLVGQNGYATIPGTGGLIIQHGRFNALGNTGNNIIWPIAFPSACYAAIAQGALTNTAAQDNYVNIRTETITRFGATAYNNLTTMQASFIAIGR